MDENQSHREFDKFASDYAGIVNNSLAISGYDSGYFDEYKVKTVFGVVGKSQQPGVALKILNFGCGTGQCERIMARYFPSGFIYSTDVSSESIRIAADLNKSLNNVIFAHFDGVTIPFDCSFDVIFCAGVFHHIPPESRHDILVKLRDKLSPGGSLFIFEHNPWNPVTRMVVASCPLDENAHLISRPLLSKLLLQAGYRAVSGRYIVFFPFWLRFLNPLERFMGGCPLGAQYYLMASMAEAHAK